MPGIAPFAERVGDFLKFLGRPRLLVIGPLGLQSPERMAKITSAIKKAVAAMIGCHVATFFDASALDASYYQKGRAHLTPDGQAELASLVAPRLHGILRIDGVCAEGAPPGIGGDGNSCYQIATCQALFSTPLVRNLRIRQADSGKRTNRLAELAKSLENGVVARSSWIANDPFLSKDAGMRPSQQDAADFLSRAISFFCGDVEGGLNGLFA